MKWQIAAFLVLTPITRKRPPLLSVKDGKPSSGSSDWDFIVQPPSSMTVDEPTARLWRFLLCGTGCRLYDAAFTELCGAGNVYEESQQPSRLAS